jgi:hypothetical protein
MSRVHEEAAAAAVGLAEAWVRFWAAVEAIERSNRERPTSCA